MTDKNKTSERIITEDRISQRIVLEILLDRCENLTIREAKQIARAISVQVRNGLSAITKENLSLTDEQANSVLFWIKQTINSGKEK